MRYLYTLVSPILLVTVTVMCFPAASACGQDTSRVGSSSVAQANKIDAQPEWPQIAVATDPNYAAHVEHALSAFRGCVAKVDQAVSQGDHEHAAALQSEAVEQLVPFLSDPTLADLRIWSAFGFFAAVKQDSENAAYAYEAIARIKPDFASDPRIADLMNQLKATHIENGVELVRESRKKNDESISKVMAGDSASMQWIADEFRRKEPRFGPVPRLKSCGARWEARVPTELRITRLRRELLLEESQDKAQRDQSADILSLTTALVAAGDLVAIANDLSPNATAGYFTMPPKDDGADRVWPTKMLPIDRAELQRVLARALLTAGDFRRASQVLNGALDDERRIRSNRRHLLKLVEIASLQSVVGGAFTTTVPDKNKAVDLRGDDAVRAALAVEPTLRSLLVRALADANPQADRSDPAAIAPSVERTCLEAWINSGDDTKLAQFAQIRSCRVLSESTKHAQPALTWAFASAAKLLRDPRLDNNKDNEVADPIVFVEQQALKAIAEAQASYKPAR